MKKFKFLAFSFAALTLLTGCGEKDEDKDQSKDENKDQITEEKDVVSCSLFEEEDSLEMSQTADFEYEDDEIKVIKMTFDFKAIDEELKTSWEEFETILDATYPEQDKDGLKIETNSNSKKYTYTIVIEVDLENATEEVLEELGFEDIDTSKDAEELKEYLESSGYTCK